MLDRAPGDSTDRAQIVGIGSAVPKKILTNADLEKIVETSDEWIFSRTGIRERHIVSEGEKFSDLCTKAAELALKRAHVKPEELDMILVGTISGDMVFPATACLDPEEHRRHATRPRRTSGRLASGSFTGCISPTA